MTKPKPKHLIVCDQCDLPWEDHEDTVWSEEELDDPITTATCVKLLKKAHQGPSGPAGPMGPRGAMGDTGRPGKDGQDGRHGLPSPQPYPTPYPSTPYAPHPGRNPITWTHTLADDENRARPQ